MANKTGDFDLQQLLRFLASGGTRGGGLANATSQMYDDAQEAAPADTGFNADDSDESGDGGANWESMMRDFLVEMNKPLDFNDPYVANILSGAQGAASQDARLRGVQGPLAVGMGQQAYVNAASQMQGQRRDAALRALGMGGQQNLAQQGLDFRNRQQNYENSLGDYDRRAANDPLTGFLSGFGTVLGAFGGQAEAGGRAGGGLGRSIYGAYNPAPTAPRHRGGWGGGGR